MKKTLVIMGSHPNGLKDFDWKRRDCDIWLFNEAPTAKDDDGKPLYPRSDAVFQLHNEAIWKSPKNRSDEKHYEWLKSGKTPTVFMQEKYKNVPKSVKYPLKDVLSLTKNIKMFVKGREKTFKYFTSTPDFALALVIEMWREGKKYKKVEIWGIELEMESEYRYQRGGFGFWFGYLTALGIKLELHSSIFDTPVYGYEGDVAISSKIIERRIEDLNKELGSDKDTYTREGQAILEKIPQLLDKDISNEIQKELNDFTKGNERIGILIGKIRESTRYLEKARAMENETGASVFSAGEFDGTRISYNKQYVDTRIQTTNLNTSLVPLMNNLLNLKKGSHKRQKALEEFGVRVADLMNKNMLLLHIVGGIAENQFYLDSVKLSIQKGGKA